MVISYTNIPYVSNIPKFRIRSHYLEQTTRVLLSVSRQVYGHITEYVYTSPGRCYVDGEHTLM